MNRDEIALSKLILTFCKVLEIQQICYTVNFGKKTVNVSEKIVNRI